MVATPIRLSPMSPSRLSPMKLLRASYRLSGLSREITTPLKNDLILRVGCDESPFLFRFLAGLGIIQSVDSGFVREAIVEGGNLVAEAQGVANVDLRLLD
jgi:hypothetical protein